MHALRLALAVPFALLAGCFGMCGPGGPSPEASCVDDAAPSGGGPTIVLGATRDGDFAPLKDGDTRALDYGDQGGQHFYYSLRAFGIDADAIAFVRFYAEGTEPTGSGGAGGAGLGGAGLGGAGGAGGGATTTSTSTSSGGEGGYGASFDPSEVVFFEEYFEAGDCEGEWFEVSGLYLQVPSAEEVSGLLRVELGTCPSSGCPVGDDGNYVPAELLASDEVRIRYVP